MMGWEANNLPPIRGDSLTSRAFGRSPKGDGSSPSFPTKKFLRNFQKALDNNKKYNYNR